MVINHGGYFVTLLLCVFQFFTLFVPRTANAGQWKVRGLDQVGANLYGITFTPKGFLAVGSGGAAASSENGSSWNVSQIDTHSWLIGVGFGNGKYFATGWNNAPAHLGQGIVFTSDDGIQWQSVLQDAPGALTRIACSNSKYVAVGGSGWFTSGGAVATSSNGANWSGEMLEFGSSYVKDVIYFQDKFLYASYGGIFASPDGENWTITSATLNSPIGLAANETSIVAVGRWGAIQRSIDGGLTWENAQNDGAYFMDVSASPNLFVAVGDNGHIATSSDGLTWISRNSHVATILEDVAYGNGGWVAVGRGGTILTSTDGIDWHIVSSPTPRFTDVVFGTGQFIAAGNEALMRSTDGVEWEIIPGQKASGIAYANGLFVCVGASEINISSNGTDWVRTAQIPEWPLTKVAWGDGQFVAVGGNDMIEYSDSIAYSSSDGVNWSPITLKAEGTLDSLAFWNGAFYANASRSGQTVVIQSGKVVSTQYNSEIPAGGLAAGPLGLLAVETSGYYNFNGVRSAEPLTANVTGAAFADGHYFIFDGGSGPSGMEATAVWISEDGSNWRDLSPTSDRAFAAAAIGNGHLVLAGPGVSGMEGTILERPMDDNLLETTKLSANATSAGLQLQWGSKLGHRYFLEQSIDLTNFTPVKDQSGGAVLTWTGTGGPLTWIDQNSGPQQMYRVRVTAP